MKVYWYVGKVNRVLDISREIGLSHSFIRHLRLGKNHIIVVDELVYISTILLCVASNRYGYLGKMSYWERHRNFK